LSVGDPNRAALIAKFLDNPEKLFVRASNRGFVIYTGKKNKVRFFFFFFFFFFFLFMLITTFVLR
jgi:uridine phosphorylase